MQQRRLRLGDILDDYCPRERRLTNHAVVAMIDDEIRQTRCTTCDAEHEFKQGKMPTLRRKKDAVSTAYQEVLAAVQSEAPTPVIASPAPPREENNATAAGSSAAQPPLTQPPPAAEPLATLGSQSEPENGTSEGGDPDETEEARVHRRLIRATLPRPENHSIERPVPEFTMRQPIGRPGKFRGGMSRGMGSRPGGGGRGGNANGNAHGPVFGRPAGNRGGGGQGGRMAARGEMHRQPRSGQPARHGKKHSK